MQYKIWPGGPRKHCLETVRSQTRTVVYTVWQRIVTVNYYYNMDKNTQTKAVKDTERKKRCLPSDVYVEEPRARRGFTGDYKQTRTA